MAPPTANLNSVPHSQPGRLARVHAVAVVLVAAVSNRLLDLPLAPPPPDAAPGLPRDVAAHREEAPAAAAGPQQSPHRHSVHHGLSQSNPFIPKSNNNSCLASLGQAPVLARGAAHADHGGRRYHAGLAGRVRTCVIAVE